MNIDELRAERATAGAEYAAAALAYREAAAKLHAFDIVYSSKSGEEFNAFAGQPDVLLHGVFLRELPPGAPWDRARELRDELLAKF